MANDRATYMREYHKGWYSQNKEKVKSDVLKYRVKNSDRLKEKAKEWKKKNPIKVKATIKKWRVANKKKILVSNRNWYHNNPDKIWGYKLKKKYGITLEDYKNRVLAQKGLCAICGRPPAQGKRLRVDHCHKTNVVRGLLCDNCNLGIGHLMENPRILLSAIKYIEDFRR